MSKKCIIVGKVYNWELKKTSTGKDYIDLTVTDSVKMTDGTWQSNYYHMKVWQSAKNFVETGKFLKSIKTVAAAKKEADKVEVVCGFELGENYKTKALEIVYNFFSVSKVVEETTPSVNNPTKYDAPVVQEEVKQEDKEEELPF